ncbi:MAG TPA: hypothetical protein VF423_05075 [Actinomycetes bacterium]
MADQIAMSPESARAAAGPEFDAAELHIASAGDVADERGRDSRFRALLARGDLRDQAAERRDRTAEVRSPVDVDPLGWLDRDWAGRDRDASAIDRADLLALLDERGVDAERSTT